MRASPLSLATAASSTPRTRTSGTRPATVERLTPGLAQGREHLLDVAQEERVGPDHEHALALEREAVRVEQVGGAVQGHRGLAGAGAALDDEHAGEGGADDLVLLALDGADDVAHVARAGLAERGQQRARAAQDHAVGEQALAGGVAVVPPHRRGRRRCGRLPGGVDEVLVLESDHRTAAHGQVAAPGQALGVEAGGPVEGLGHGGAPVDDERLVVGARDGQAPDVEGLAQEPWQLRRRGQVRAARSMRPK